MPCHAGVVEPGKLDAAADGRSVSRVTSTNEQWKQGVCVPCHVQADLERTLPQNVLAARSRASPAITASSRARNRSSARPATRSRNATIATTSDADSCRSRSECRRSIDRRFVHRGDFVVRHAIEAESQPARCLRCHTAESCDACHVARGVSANRLGAQNPHPPGWVGTNPNTRSFHGREARRDILACAPATTRAPPRTAFAATRSAASAAIRIPAAGGAARAPAPRCAGTAMSRPPSTLRLRAKPSVAFGLLVAALARRASAEAASSAASRSRCDDRRGALRELSRRSVASCAIFCCAPRRRSICSEPTAHVVSGRRSARDSL